MKKLLYIVYVPLLLTEWVVDMIVGIIKTIHNSIETLTLAVEKKLDEPTRPEPTD